MKTKPLDIELQYMHIRNLLNSSFECFAELDFPIFYAITCKVAEGFFLDRKNIDERDFG
jgi:hypothetical protein